MGAMAAVKLADEPDLSCAAGSFLTGANSRLQNLQGDASI